MSVDCSCGTLSHTLPCVPDIPVDTDRIMGLNWMPILCFESNNQRIDSLNEIQKAGVAASTTLMTLLPALLIFSPFWTARTGLLIVFSTSAALLTAGFTLGLATSDVMTQHQMS